MKRHNRMVIGAWTAVTLLMMTALPAHAASEGISVATLPNKLKIGVMVQFDPRVQTVQQAAFSLLESTGYRMVIPHATARETMEIMTRPLTPLLVQRGLMSVEDALLLMIGEDSRLVADHAAKLITFEPMPALAGAKK